MSGLVPEVRVDVNGRRVTRHVKPSTVPASVLRKIPEPHLYSTEFSQSFANAQAVGELLYSFDDNGQMLDVFGDEIHDYGFEEAVDALSEMLPSAILASLRQNLENAEGRHKQILWEQVANDVYDYCLNKQQSVDNERLSSNSRASIASGIVLSSLADDFAESGVERVDITTAIYNSTRSVRRECRTPEWEVILDDDEKRQRLVESEFIVNFVTKESIDRYSGLAPVETFQQRMAIMDEYDRVKKHQGEFAKRRKIDLGILDEMDKMSFALREGTL
jgi:hypothetical protein